MEIRPKLNGYQDEITFVAEHIVKIRYSGHFTAKEMPAAEQAAAYSAASLLGYEMQREVTNDLVQSAFTEVNFIEKEEDNDNTSN